MKSHPNVVILTSTVDPSVANVNVAINNKEERHHQYLSNIKRIILKSNFDIIIFCENSNYQHDYTDLINLAKENGKELETLIFMGSNEIIKVKGKGYGEGEILNYAVNNSKYLQSNEATFYKLTGRVYIKNVNRILSKTKASNVMIKWDIRKKSIDTRFFKTEVGFFKKHVSHLLDLPDERTHLSIEEVYFNELRGNAAISSFKFYPLITGICASLGKPYDLNPFKLFYRRVQLFLGILDVKRY